jgi:hypothetical protein
MNKGMLDNAISNLRATKTLRTSTIEKTATYQANTEEPQIMVKLRKVDRPSLRKCVIINSYCIIYILYLYVYQR